MGVYCSVWDIRISSVAEQHLCDAEISFEARQMQRSVAIALLAIWIGTIIQQKLYYPAETVISGLMKRSFSQLFSNINLQSDTLFPMLGSA